jgi:hypothetical protein
MRIWKRRASYPPVYPSLTICWRQVLKEPGYWAYFHSTGGFLRCSVNLRPKIMTRIDGLITLHSLDDESCKHHVRAERWVNWIVNVQKSSVVDAVTQTQPRRAIDNGAGKRKSPMKSELPTFKQRLSVNIPQLTVAHMLQNGQHWCSGQYSALTSSNCPG